MNRRGTEVTHDELAAEREYARSLIGPEEKKPVDLKMFGQWPAGENPERFEPAPPPDVKP